MLTAIPKLKTDLIARNFNVSNRTEEDIWWLVIHDMQMPEQPTTAESCRNYFNSFTAGGSAHVCFDNDSAVVCIRDKDIAWAAYSTANLHGIHFEHAGYARQTAKEWADDFSVDMLTISAYYAAEKCKKYNIPVKRLSTSEIRAHKRGIVGHLDLTNAKIDSNNHTDPGPNFPWDWYLNKIKSFMEGEEMPFTTDDAKTLYKADVLPAPRFMDDLEDNPTWTGERYTQAQLEYTYGNKLKLNTIINILQAQNKTLEKQMELIQALASAQSVDVSAAVAAFTEALNNITVTVSAAQKEDEPTP